MPKFANLPLAPDAKITSGTKTLQLTDLKAGNVLSLHLTVHPVYGLAVAGIKVVDVKVIYSELFGPK